MQPEKFEREFSVSRGTVEKLKTYEALLLKWQPAINLIGPNTLENIWERHFADSAQLAVYISQKSVVADVGTGAGFPGLVLAMLRPDLKMHLIESDGRKVEFLHTVSRETNIPVTIHNDRAEDILSKIRPTLMTARAFAPLTQILDLAHETCRSATLLLPKGKDYGEELLEARHSYSFIGESFPSRTDSHAWIFLITNLEKRS